MKQLVTIIILLVFVQTSYAQKEVDKRVRLSLGLDYGVPFGKFRNSTTNIMGMNENSWGFELRINKPVYRHWCIGIGVQSFYLKPSDEHVRNQVLYEYSDPGYFTTVYPVSSFDLTNFTLQFSCVSNWRGFEIEPVLGVGICFLQKEFRTERKMKNDNYHETIAIDHSGTGYVLTPGLIVNHKIWKWIYGSAGMKYSYGQVPVNETETVTDFLGNVNSEYDKSTQVISMLSTEIAVQFRLGYKKPAQKDK